MPGPPPKKPGERRRTNKPVSGEWKEAPGRGWQHGEVPDLAVPEPAAATVEAWRAWFSSWWASNWSPQDIPGLTLVAREYDKAVRGTVDLVKIKSLLDAYGITPEGRQKLHWLPPKEEKPQPESSSGRARLAVVDAS